MRFGGLQKTSLIDFPGRTAAVLFAQGCNLRCPYCHNSQLVDPRCFATPLDETELWSFLKRRRNQLEGVVVSGGEPTIWDDLPDVLARLRELGYAVKLDTNGTRPEVLRHILRAELVDYIAMDVKAPLDTYNQLAGKPVPTAPLRESIWLLKQSGIACEFRTTVIPGLHTTKEIKQIAEAVRGASVYAVQEFSPANAWRPDLRKRSAFPLEALEELRPYIEKRVEHYLIRYSAQTETSSANTPKREAALTAA